MSSGSWSPRREGSTHSKTFPPKPNQIERATQTHLDVLHRCVDKKLHRHAPPPPRTHAGAQVQAHHKPVLPVREPQDGFRRHFHRRTRPGFGHRHHRRSGTSSAVGLFGGKLAGWGRNVAVAGTAVAVVARQPCCGCSPRPLLRRLRRLRRRRLIGYGKGTPAPAVDDHVGVQ